jgi:threonine efflux protein
MTQADLQTAAVLGLAYAAIVVSPGANFVLVTQMSLGASRRHAVITALGVACGVGAVALVALAGAAQLSQSPSFWIVNIVFAAILIRLAFAAMRRACLHRCFPADVAPPGQGRCFRLGMVTALGNPVTLAFFMAQAGAVEHGGLKERPLLGTATVFLVALAWFGTLALSFSQQSLRVLYTRIRRYADAAAGLCVLELGLQLFLQALY